MKPAFLSEAERQRLKRPFGESHPWIVRSTRVGRGGLVTRDEARFTNALVAGDTAIYLSIAHRDEPVSFGVVEPSHEAVKQ